MLFLDILAWSTIVIVVIAFLISFMALPIVEILAEKESNREWTRRKEKAERERVFNENLKWAEEKHNANNGKNSKHFHFNERA